MLFDHIVYFRATVTNFSLKIYESNWGNRTFGRTELWIFFAKIDDRNASSDVISHELSLRKRDTSIPTSLLNIGCLVVHYWTYLGRINHLSRQKKNANYALFFLAFNNLHSRLKIAKNPLL